MKSRSFNCSNHCTPATPYDAPVSTRANPTCSGEARKQHSTSKAGKHASVEQTPSSHRAPSQRSWDQHDTSEATASKSHNLTGASASPPKLHEMSTTPRLSACHQGTCAIIAAMPSLRLKPPRPTGPPKDLPPPFLPRPFDFPIRRSWLCTKGAAGDPERHRSPPGQSVRPHLPHAVLEPLPLPNLLLPLGALPDLAPLLEPPEPSNVKDPWKKPRWVRMLFSVARLSLRVMNACAAPSSSCANCSSTSS